MLYLLLLSLLYILTFCITFSIITVIGVWYQAYIFFTPYGIKYSWNIKPYINKTKQYFTGREHFVEYDYQQRKKYPGERFIGRMDRIEPVIVLQDLVLIRKLTINNFHHFVDRKVYTDEFESFMSRCLYFLEDKRWQDMRSTISPAFTTFRVKQMIPFIVYVAEDVVNLLIYRILNDSDNCLEIDARKVASFMVNDVIANCVYGLPVSTIRNEKNEFYEMGNIIANDRNSYFHFDTPNIDEAQNYFVLLAVEKMNTRQFCSSSRPDMLQLLVQARQGKLKHDDRSSDDKKEFGFASAPELKSGKKRGQTVWSELDFAAQAVSFHADGYNTVVTALSFALHELALQPQIQDRLAQEIKFHHQRNRGNVTFQSIKNMKYMDMVVSETLRLWPPITNLERVCVKDWLMGKPNPRAPKEFMIKCGTRVWIPIWAIHRDPDFFPNPDIFDPERFSEQNIANINPMAYMPFGSGPRNCIGSKFALCELKICLYYIILRTEVYPSKNTCIPSKLCPKVCDIRLKDGHMLNFKARSII